MTIYLATLPRMAQFDGITLYFWYNQKIHSDVTYIFENIWKSICVQFHGNLHLSNDSTYGQIKARFSRYEKRRERWYHCEIRYNVKHFKGSSKW